MNITVAISVAALMFAGTRSASVLIEEDSTLFRLSVSDMERMQESHPSSTGKLHAYIVKLLSEYLGRANRELQRYL